MSIDIWDADLILSEVGAGSTAGSYPLPRLHVSMSNWLSLIVDVMHTYRANYPSLPTLQNFEDWDESQSEEWSAYLDCMDDFLRSVFGRYLDVCSDWYYVSDLISQLDKNNTIDQPPSSIPVCISERQFRDGRYASTISKSWSNFLESVGTQKEYRIRHDLVRAPAAQDEISRMLVKGTYAARGSQYCMRLHNQIEIADKAGWFMVFDTLTLSSEKLDNFYENKNALRDYFRTIGRMVSLADLRRSGVPEVELSTRGGHKRIDRNMADCFRYFCVPEYGSEKGRLHFHVLFFARTLPLGTRDPNYTLTPARRIRRQVPTMTRLWPYGYNLPVAVRYSGDAFSRAGWYWPVDKKGKPIKSKPAVAVAHYITKYVTKQTSALIDAKGLNGDTSSCQVQARYLNQYKSHFRVRMSRSFGMEMPSMDNLSNSSLLQMCKLSWKSVNKTTLLKHHAKRTLKRRLGTLTLEEFQAIKPPTVNLLESLRVLIRQSGSPKRLNFTSITPPRLQLTDVSDELRLWLEAHQLVASKQPPKVSATFAGR